MLSGTFKVSASTNFRLIDHRRHSCSLPILWSISQSRSTLRSSTSSSHSQDPTGVTGGLARSSFFGEVTPYIWCALRIMQLPAHHCLKGHASILWAPCPRGLLAGRLYWIWVWGERSPMWVRAAISILLFLLPAAAFAQTEVRIALLIGNQAYADTVGPSRISWRAALINLGLIV